jgi:hypothetical protein
MNRQQHEIGLTQLSQKQQTYKEISKEKTIALQIN